MNGNDFLALAAIPKKSPLYSLEKLVEWKLEQLPSPEDILEYEVSDEQAARWLTYLSDYLKGEYEPYDEQEAARWITYLKGEYKLSDEQEDRRIAYLKGAMEVCDEQDNRWFAYLTGTYKTSDEEMAIWLDYLEKEDDEDVLMSYNNDTVYYLKIKKYDRPNQEPTKQPEEALPEIF